jgi:hypothetical protein
MMSDHETDMNDAIELTSAGHARKALILARAFRAQRWRVRRRRAAKGAGATLALVALVAIGRIGLAPAPTTAPPPDAPTIVETPRYEVIRTTPSAYDRFAVTNIDSNVTIIDDDELLDLLAKRGDRAGIVRAQGRTRIVGEIDVVTPEPRDESSSG